MARTAELYDEDFVLWTEEQAQALRRAAGASSNLPLDWENLAEEIEFLGGSNRAELRSRLGTIIEHLLKLEHSPAANLRRGWTETVFRERARVEAVVEDSPSLRRELSGFVKDEMQRTRKLTLALLSQYGEADPKVTGAISNTEYTADQVLGDWLPAGPQTGR